VTDTISALKKKMEKGQEATRKQMQALQEQQEKLEMLKSPEDIVKFMASSGMKEEDLQRMFSGDVEHMEACMKGMLDKAMVPEGKNPMEDADTAVKAAEKLHSTLMGSGQEAPEDGKAAPADPAAPTRPASVKKKPAEEEVKIPEHRLQYEKDSDGRYTNVELRCIMPGISSMSAIALDVSEKHVRLSTVAPAPKYVVNAGPFPVLIEPSEARAKYSKKREELTVSVPAKADR